MKRLVPSALGLGFAVALGGYLAVGSPGMPDQPIARRTAEIAAKNPADLTRAEALARLELLTRDRPDDPKPHFFIGRMLADEGRPEDAVRAFQSALRRDPDHAPALVALADTVVQLEGGEISDNTRALYAQGFARDPSDIRAGFMLGLADWRAGRPEMAESRWQAIAGQLAPASPQAQQLALWIAAVRNESQPPD